MTRPDRLGDDVGRSLKLAGIPCLDLAAQRRALAEGARDVIGRRCTTDLRSRLDRDVAKAGTFEVGSDDGLVVVAVRRADHESRRVVGKQFFQRDRGFMRQHIVLDPIPDVEHERAVSLQDAFHLFVSLDAIRKEHGAELAADHVELGVAEGQSHCVGLAPGDAIVIRLALRGDREHRLVEIGRDITDAARQRRRHGARHGAGARGDLEQHGGSAGGDASCDVLRIDGEDHRNEILVVDFRNRAGENLVSVGHVCLAAGSNAGCMLPHIFAHMPASPRIAR